MAKGKYEYWLTPEGLLNELRKPIRYEFVGNEMAFEKNIVENIDLICQALNLPEILTVVEQKIINADDFYIKPDIMIRHKDGTMTVFEVKKSSNKYPSTGPSNQMNAIGQCLLYKNIIECRIQNNVRVAIIDTKIYYRTYCTFMSYRLPITLIEFQKDKLFVPYKGW